MHIFRFKKEDIIEPNMNSNFYGYKSIIKKWKNLCHPVILLNDYYCCDRSHGPCHYQTS